MNPKDSPEIILNEINKLKDINKKLESALKENKSYNKELIENEQFLSVCALELVELPEDMDIHDFLASKLKEVFPESTIVVTSYDEHSNHFVLASITGIKEKEAELFEKLMGKGFMESEADFNKMNKELRDDLFNKTLNEVEGGLYIATGQIFPKNLSKMAEKIIGIKKVYGMGLTWNEKLYGSVVIVSLGEDIIRKKEIVETLVSMVSVAFQRKKAENEMKNALKEKELLMKEIHHRSKNNLMIISSLLNLKSQNIKDPHARAILKESQDRAKSMALIHEHLYSSKDLKRINFGEYLRTLALNLFKSYVDNSKHIKLNLNIEDSMLDINTAVALGLITNELITNSIKYAFPNPDENEGEITLEFHKSNDIFILIIKDNGIGFPDDLDFHNSPSMGLKIVNMLISQIDGDIKLNNDNGAEFIITFEDLY
ncbi:MAG: sensor histidine kinase [Methanobacterium sp.]|uniref:sensor histidine kinase n=1 Tax=Methanobacterium sp. TaxID=2164 RepID=UPI003D64891B|nr:sensor histidine kinase [Methanobacterium sp.]